MLDASWQHMGQKLILRVRHKHDNKFMENPLLVIQMSLSLHYFKGPVSLTMRARLPTSTQQLRKL